jgi:hypothetical protein
MRPRQDHLHGEPVTQPRLTAITAVLLVTALTGCSASTVTAEDSKPSAVTETASAPGAPGGVPLDAAITDIPTATETRDGYDRDAFKHWVDADDDG